MNNTETLNHYESIVKLKTLVQDIVVCLFCTNLKSNDISTCRPMSAIKVCNEGNIWFFSEKESDKNRAIVKDNIVQLFFSHPGISSYLVVNGEAEITIDKEKIEELWTPIAKIWFKEGKTDPSISVIKVKPNNAYYWDTDGNRMVNFFNMVTSIITGTDLVSGNQGALKI